MQTDQIVTTGASSATPVAAPPFFIVGNDRSGTTMLRLILDRSAAFAIPTESMFLGDFAPVRRGAGGRGARGGPAAQGHGSGDETGGLGDHAAAAAFARRVWQHPKVRLWGMDGEPPVPPTGLSHDEAYRWCVEAPYLEFMRREGKTRWGDKTPYYIEHVDEIAAIFPEARFVELVRDGRDVALSIMPLPFGANNAYVAARDWARGIRLGRAAAARYPERWHTVRYEQLTAEPEAHIRALCAFLDISFTPDMLNVEKTDQRKVVADQAAWFGNLWAGINQGSVGKWKRKMPERDCAIFQAVAGEELDAHGYEPGPRPIPVGGIDAARWQAGNFGQRLVNLWKLRIVQERGRELRYVARRKLQRG